MLASMSMEELEEAEAEASGLAETVALALWEADAEGLAVAEAVELGEGVGVAVAEAVDESLELADAEAEESSVSASTLELAESVQPDAPRRIVTSASITSKRDTGVDRLTPFRARCCLRASSRLLATLRN